MISGHFGLRFGDLGCRRRLLFWGFWEFLAGRVCEILGFGRFWPFWGGFCLLRPHVFTIWNLGVFEAVLGWFLAVLARSCGKLAARLVNLRAGRSGTEDFGLRMGEFGEDLLEAGFGSVFGLDYGVSVDKLGNMAALL
jgi:hypothetical protein